MEDLLRKGLAELGLPAEGVPALLRYGALLLETNRVLNLTAITEPAEVASRHFLDCAALLTLEDFRGKSLIDVGSGAGFPGLPVRILEPSVRLTLLDAQQKRVRFLENVCRELELPDVRCIHGRAEELDSGMRESFDLAASRAVADLRILCELCLPFLRAGGRFLAMKSLACGEELEGARNAVRVLGGEVDGLRDYTIPGTDIQHRVVVIRKVRGTPEGYPRSFAKIKKKPL